MCSATAGEHLQLSSVAWLEQTVLKQDQVGPSPLTSSVNRNTIWFLVEEMVVAFELLVLVSRIWVLFTCFHVSL